MCRRTTWWKTVTVTGVSTASCVGGGGARWERGRHRLAVAMDHCGRDRGEQHCRGEQQVAGRRAGRAGQRLCGRLHATVEVAVVQLRDGAVLRPPALQVTVLRLVLSHRVGLYVPANTRTRILISV